VVFQVGKEEDVILDWEYFFDLNIVINNDGGVDRGDVVYQERFKDGDDDEGSCCWTIVMWWTVLVMRNSGWFNEELDFDFVVVLLG
jgi:hypothetical protein